ncbi:uncharacterized protein LOC6051849 isoform X2 [Culex quinquefasciatus]|uniref:uncharacterized protein LOC6051849 isoform X2 n=1 Tax=Culex quinquefasciatus TaxID=7176 RepID=UPI0018E3E363|nr:uncharacterized protein LOC6051849 isoform X2 [Culex quinquefasciatus]
MERNGMIDALERFWEPSETPPWLKESLETIAASYQNTRAELNQIDSQQLSEYHQLMFYHDHGLAVHLNNCYFLGKLDLHSTQIFLNRCLQNYDKIPADDRDHSVDDSSEHVRELLEEVTGERHKLTASLKSSTHKEYVESCLALGSIDNNSELLPHLQECSGQDKKHLGQLLWCTQLVRLVISLEEAALGLTFQRAEIPAQNETCLARAYHLVQHGEPSKGDSKRPNPEHKPDREEVLYGGAKERVRSTIYSEVMQYKMSLEQVKCAVVRDIGQELSAIDIAFVEDEYKTICLDQCLEEITQSMASFLRGSKEIDILNNLNLIEHMKSWDDIPEHFKTLDYHKELLKLTLNEDEEHSIVQRFKVVCLEHIDNFCESVKGELGLLSCLTSYLSQSRNVKVVAGRLGAREQSPKVDFRNVMNLTDLENNEHLTELKCMVSNLPQGTQLIIEDKIQETIRRFIDPVQVDTVMIDGRAVVEVLGKHILLSDVLESVENELANELSISEVRFIGWEVFHVDADLVNDIWYGKNIAVRSKLVMVHGTVVWDVSGKHCVHTYSPARSAIAVGGEGSSGLDGLPGESGGNVLILTERMTHCEQLSIISNGGNGGDGQDGGNGQKGQDGVGIKREELEKDFKSPVRFIALASTRAKGAQRMVEQIARRFPTTSKKEIRDSEYFIEACGLEGQRIVFSYCEPKIFQNYSHCYLVYKGSLGKPGGQGGDFGREGQGGFPGHIVVKNIASGEIFNVQKSTTRGQDGRPGAAGLYGNTGLNGWDMGYLDYQMWRLTYYYGEDYKSKFTVKYHDDSRKDSVWCWHKNKYASITHATRPENSFQNCHQRRQFVQRDRRQTSAAVMKKTIVESSFTAKYDQYFNSVDENVLLNIYNRMECIRQRAMDGSVEQRKKTNKRQRVHHLISHHNIEQDIGEPLPKIPSTTKRNTFKSTSLMSSAFKSDSVVNWKQLRHCRIEKSDFQGKLVLFESLKKKQTKLTAKDVHTIEQILIDKYKLLAFEEFSDKIDADTINNDYLELASRYTSICLEEDRKQSGIAWHDSLGTLDEYLFQTTNKRQQQKLSFYCESYRKHFPPSVVQAFLLEVAISKNVVPSVQTHLDRYKFFAELQDYDSAVLRDQFAKELVQSTFSNSVVRLWYHGNEDLTLAPKLIDDINRDYRLGNLRARYINSLIPQFGWGQCLQDDQFFETFRSTIVREGPLTGSFRELLATAFGVNIRIYVRDSRGKLSLQHNHNPEANGIVYLLQQNDSFFKLSLNENLMKLEDSRRSRAKKYSEISAHLTSLGEKQLIDSFMADDLLMRSATKSDEKNLCNVNLVEDLVKYFSFGERHTVEKLFTKSDVSNSAHNQLLRNLLLRFDTEGKHISTDEVYFLVNHYLIACAEGLHEETITSWIVLAYPQHYWVREILLLNLERYFKELLVKKSEWRLHLSKVENKSILILLSSKLDQKKPENSLTVEKVDRMLRLLYLSNIKPEALQKLDLPEWFYVLEEIFWTEKLKEIARWPQNSQKFKEASYYTVSLLNNYSFEMIEKLFDKLERHHVTDINIVNTLWNVYNGRCILTEEDIGSLDEVGFPEWLKKMKNQAIDYQERGIAILVQLILENKHASENILKKMPEIKKDIQKMNRERGIINNLLKKDPTNLLTNVKGKFFKGYMSQTVKFANKSTLDKLRDIDDAIHENFNFRLRNSQKLTVLTLLSNDTNTLAQVSTGEGKSLIVVAVAIIKASQGQKVDIITSSSVLAKRDAEQSKSIYAKFGINVSHNCSEDIEKRKEAYSGNQVVYGDLSSFQRDYLLHKFYQKNVLGDRDFVNVIVDEVDSMLLDRGNNMLYLSHDLPDMDKLESVYVFIWQWVNNSSNGFDSTLIRDAVLWQLYGVLKCTDIGKIDATLSEEKRNFIWNKLVEAKIIDGDGKLMTENIKNDVLGELLGSEYSVYLDRLEYLLTEYINREKFIHVPNYLRSFVDLHLESWIEAAKMALVMEAGHDYVVDVDRSGSSADRTPNITILDRDTGTDLVNSQWEAALHQFVQLKHGCKTYLQSLKAVFISNVTFFKLYDKLYGLSGTLGSQRERDLLEEIYAVDFVNVPTAKCKLFYEYVPIVCKSAADWTDTIIESAKRLTETDGRSVLIICETLNEVAELYKEFGGKNATNVRTYTREYEEFDTGELSPGQIIIATNLAGRGTDIKLTQKLKGAGGVHVCLTYLPSNIRVEQQAFGRAARCGDRGSGQLIVLDQKEILNIMLLKRLRDTRELARISLIKKHYETRVVLEENCFRQFTHQFDELRNLLTASKITNGKEELSDILLGSCLDRWVFWLDNNGKNLVSNAKHHSRKTLDISLANFLSHLKSLKVTNFESLLDWVDISTPRMIKLGRYFIENKQAALAHTLFEKVIAAEPQFCEAALYYKAYALSTKITWNVVNSPEVKTFSHTLRSAADMFEERVQNLMINVSRVDKIKTNFKHNILPITAYKEQKQIICKFYGALTQSVNDILGHPITATSFEFGDTIDKSRSIEIFNALQAKKIVQNPIIKDNISEKELRDISYNYGTSAAKLLNFLEKCRTTQGRSVQLEKFVRLLKQQVILPSREGFWRHLVEQEILSKKKEEKYILVDKTKLSVKDIEYFDSMLSLPGLKTKVTIKEGELLLYPDQLLDGDAYNKDSFKKAIDPAKYAAFKELGAISFQRKTKFNLDQLKTKQVNFNHYDSISLEDFAMVNISQNDANGILDLLVRGKVLQKQDGNKELYKLHTDGSRINGIQLGEYKIYEVAVRGLLNLCFCYRIAYQSITRCANNGRAQDFPLISKPHRRILADLLHARILEPAVSRFADIEDLRKALSGMRLEEDSLVKVAQRLKSLKGSMDSLRMVPFSEYDRYTNVEEWNLFSLNGNELLLKLRGASFMKIVGTFLWGALLIRAALVQNIKMRRTELSRQDLSKYSTGWQYICSAIRMAFDVYGTDYYKLQYNKFIKRVALIEATNFGFFGDRLNKFAFEVTQPATSKPDIKYVRKLAVPLIRGFDLVSRTANVQLLIDDRLKLMCTERSDCLLSSIDKNAAFSAFEECLKKLFRFMDVDEARKKLIKLTEMHLQRQQYFKNIEAILVKVADNVLQALSRATKRPNVHITVSTILSVDINDAWVTALKDNERNLAMIVTNIVQELTGKLNLLIAENSVEDQTAITVCEGFVEEAIVNLKAQLHEKLDVLLQQTIHRPVQERGRFLLLNYAEGQIELQTDSNDGPNPGEDIAKKIRIGQLKKESDKRRQALAMTPVENLLDQQFNEALAKWERTATELERLTVSIRKGEPVDGQYLDICLDAVRFVLLRRAVVVSNICVNLMTDGKTRNKISSPRNSNGIAMDLHLMDNKFLVGKTQKPSGKLIRNSNCLYDCLLTSIFELRSISSKQFALEISQHLVKVMENQSNPEPTLRQFLDFNKPSTFKELCFAQFLSACLESPARGVVAFGDLMERAKIGPLDWHGTGCVHVQAVTIHNSKRFVEAGFTKNATTDTVFGRVMSDLREAFFKVFQ